jgi:hypothetical protein
MLQPLRTREAKLRREQGGKDISTNTHLDSLLVLANLRFELRGLERELLVRPDKRLRDAQRHYKSARKGS